MKQRDKIDILAEKLWAIGWDAGADAGSEIRLPTMWDEREDYIKAAWRAVAAEVIRMVEEAQNATKKI